MFFAHNSNKLTSPSLPDTLERLRLTANMSSHEWFDVLQVSWVDYQQIKLGRSVPSEKLTERAAGHFNLNAVDVLAGHIDYTSLALSLEAHDHVMPDVYSKAAFGRMRTSITSVDFLEKYVGWRLRLDVIRKLSVSERLLLDPFAPISMKFITDLCDYLHQRQFQKADFFAMGAFSYEGNKNSLVAQLFLKFQFVDEAYEFFFNDCMKIFEQNCTYTITQISKTTLTLEYLTNPDVAAESGVRHLGSAHICQVKCGIFANIPRYLGLPAAKIKEVSCVHCGDDVCRLELDFSEANKIQPSQLFLNH